MLAFLLSGAVFSYWFLLGFALLLVASPSSLSPLTRFLLAPGVGLSLTLLPVFWLSRLDIPVRDFAAPLTLASAAATAAVIGWRWRAGALGLPPIAGPALGALAIVLALIGWPFLAHGFDWISVANDDMANYVLAAHRFVDNGFFTAPPLDALLRSTDTPQAYWFMHGAGGVRPGSELTLAWLISLTGLDGFHLFMPTIVALHLVMIAAVTALIAAEIERGWLAVAGILLMAVNPLIAFGTVSQLIGQVGGLALLAASLSTLNAPWRHESRGDLIRAAALAGGALAAFLVWYPEAAPFLGLGVVLYMAITIRRWLGAWRRVGPLAAVIAGLMIAATGHYFAQSVVYLLGQAAGGTRGGGGDVLFPYFLIPSGVSTFWGFQALATDLSEPWQSLVILAGLALLPPAVVVIVAVARRGALIGCVALVMAAMAALLFARGVDFGLFKIAMFIQPFLVGTVLLFLARPADDRAGAEA